MAAHKAAQPPSQIAALKEMSRECAWEAWDAHEREHSRLRNIYILRLDASIQAGQEAEPAAAEFEAAEVNFNAAEHAWLCAKDAESANERDAYYRYLACPCLPLPAVLPV